MSPEVFHDIFSKNDKVFISPLGWGLGHATRLIPIINILIAKGCNLVVGADTHTLNLLQKHFPRLEYVHFPSIKVRFARGRVQFFSLARVALQVLLLSIREHRKVKKIIDNHEITAVLSDNRYGLYSKPVKSVLITHQLNPIFPRPVAWMSLLGKFFIRRHVRKFTACWVPDNTHGIQISGKLNSGWEKLPNVRLVGLLSRFQEQEFVGTEEGYDMVALLSGPSPQREILEQKVVTLSQKLKLHTLIVQGLPQQESEIKRKGEVDFVPHLADEPLAKELLSARYIICRSGYSTIMDLLALQRKALLVPTPGQTEQEYLAEHLKEEKLFQFCVQQDLEAISIDELKSSHDSSSW